MAFRSFKTLQMGFNKTLRKQMWLSLSREVTVASALLLQIGSNKKRKRLWLSLGATAGSTKKRRQYSARATQVNTKARKARKLQISPRSLQEVKKAETKAPKAAGTAPPCLGVF